MVDLERVSYWYPESRLPALDSIDLHLEPGDRLLVSGLSGAGKSTLLRVFNGLVPHLYGGRFRGRARIGGLDVHRAGPMQLAARVGMVFQEPQARFLSASVEDEIAFGLEVAGLAAGEIRRRVAEVIERLDLGPLMSRALDRLSAGEQARVAIAAGLARRPAMLVLDEPSTELDPMAAQALVEWLGDLTQDRGLTLVLAEHRLGRWMENVNRMAYLEAPGRMVACDGPSGVTKCMPYADPLQEAARRLGLEDTDDHSALAQAVHALPDPAPPSRAASDPARLSTRGLEFSYNHQTVLRGVDLDVAPGEAVGLVGRNGSGKTTLLRCLMGLEEPASGEVLLDGSSLSQVPVATRARHIGFVSQTPSSMLFADSVEGELEFTLRSHGLWDQPPVDPSWMLEALGLTAVRGAYPRDLSAGQRQRVALAAVMVTHPEVLLLDEPTLGMDPMAQRELGELMRSWSKDGTAVIVASHDVEFLAAHTDRILVLQDGRIADQGPTRETLFAQPGFRTALQTLTGRPWPASAEDVGRSAHQ